MFSEPIGQLNTSKSTFSEKVDDAFGRSIINDTYEPFEKDLQQLTFAWDEAEMKKMEIVGLLMEIRTII